MNDIFVKLLYESIVKENLQLKDLYEAENITSKKDDYWKKATVLSSLKVEFFMA
ncbi:hypothetical protein [uncultured Psychrobacillus sp.]|uniref:hypothetical protein n=1 Tax=uncultured Psychrobacillus sp. TaxID=1551585 RepID=UPI00262E2EBD|nr:hypothetical protein [uncultured Psychrobacillus sp.]